MADPENKSGANVTTSAADEPTAMWDEDSLREAGLDLGARSSSRPRSRGTGTDPGLSRMPRRQASGGLSWTLTILLALALGAAVFFAVRALRG